ncbi:NAD(P)-binding protein [Mycena olivaceomarginata]|nr:NAD(P)-binding protein [Mycena olivaceomarginata]
MTITQAQSVPLVAVVGATGVQGGSVIKALVESNKPYRIRGFTRDATKPAAEALKKRGVEVVAVNLVLENKEEVYKAFVGVDYAFLVTNYWEHMSLEREVSEGKLLIDAAKATGVKGIIWSGLISIKKISGGKYTNDAFEGKAQVTEYGRAAGVPFVDVQAGAYATNFLKSSFPFVVKEADGTYALPSVAPGTTVMPIIDMEHDYGFWDLSQEDQARQISEGTGKKVVFKQITPEVAMQRLVSLGFPPAAAAGIIDTFQFMDEFGYYGGNPSTNTDGLARPTRTFAEWAKSADWSKVLV